MEHMTEEELIAWEERHENAVMWWGRWGALVWVLGTGSLIAILSGSVMNFWVLVALTAVAWLMKRRSERDHEALHDEYEGHEQ